jgi:hypothetical protein
MALFQQQLKYAGRFALAASGIGAAAYATGQVARAG